MAHLLEVLLAVDIAVLRPDGVALVVEGEEVQTTTHTFHEGRTRDRGRQDPDVEEGDGHTLIRDRLLEHPQGGEEDHHRHLGVRRGGDGGARAIARIAATAGVGAGAGAGP